MTLLHAFFNQELTASLNSETFLSAIFVMDVFIFQILTNRVMSTSRRSKSFERSLLLLALHGSSLPAWSPLPTTIKHLLRVGNPRLYDHPYQSPQLELWPPQAVEWFVIIQATPYGPRPRQKRATQILVMQPPPLAEDA
jgi:hypothetical protein